MVSDDLAATLAGHPGARGRWGTHSRARSAETLERIVQAKPCPTPGPDGSPRRRPDRQGETVRLGRSSVGADLWCSAPLAPAARPTRYPAPVARLVAASLPKQPLGSVWQCRTIWPANGSAGRPGHHRSAPVADRPCWGAAAVLLDAVAVAVASRQDAGLRRSLRLSCS
jgi:hypothetical protein